MIKMKKEYQRYNKLLNSGKKQCFQAKQENNKFYVCKNLQII